MFHKFTRMFKVGGRGGGGIVIFFGERQTLPKISPLVFFENVPDDVGKVRGRCSYFCLVPFHCLDFISPKLFFASSSENIEQTLAESAYMQSYLLCGSLCSY